jgi:hypothetical protein
VNAAPLDWLEPLSDVVASRLVAGPEDAPLGAHLQASPDEHGETVWELSLFFGATEVVGGPRDGERTRAAFWFDLAGLTEAFDRVDSFAWQAARLGADDDLGPHVAIEGVFRGRRVCVRMLAEEPSGLPPARSVEARDPAIVERW